MEHFDVCFLEQRRRTKLKELEKKDLFQSLSHSFIEFYNENVVRWEFVIDGDE